MMKAIAHIKSPFTTKFGVPRQSGLVDELCCEIHFEPEFRNPDALRGIDKFDYIWLIWDFSLNREREGWHPTVRPPRLGGNTGVGVFASRSPYRPNPLGLSSVRLLSVDFEKCILKVSGADLADGTPIYDIKPYIAYADAHPEASGGFVDEVDFPQLKVVMPGNAAEILGKKNALALEKALLLDPRPQYQNDPEKIYGMSFAGCEVRFTVREQVLTVLEIVRGNI